MKIDIAVSRCPRNPTYLSWSSR